jgi:hypothetical protein
VSAKNKIEKLFLLCALFTPGLTATESCRGGQPPNPEVKGHLKRISIRVYRSYLVVVQGQFGEASDPQNLILDTGTSLSIINEDIVQQLALPTSDGRIAAVGMAVPTRNTILQELEIGPLKVGPLRVAVANLSEVQHDLGFRIGGIIGMDVLGSTDFLIDYEKKCLQLGDAPANGIPVPIDVRSGVATTEVLIANTRVRMVVDTGSESVLLLGGNFPGHPPFDLRFTSERGGSLAADKAAIQAFSPADIVLAGQHFRQKRAYFAPGRVDPQFDGLLGVRALGFRAISFHRERRTMYLVR